MVYVKCMRDLLEKEWEAGDVMHVETSGKTFDSSVPLPQNPSKIPLSLDVESQPYECISETWGNTVQCLVERTPVHVNHTFHIENHILHACSKHVVHIPHAFYS